AMARMAQDFSMRYVLVDGQGNFGSVDGDGPAAMRYTEARLAPIAQEMLRDLDKETVDFVPNFDGTLQEPTVLPATLPNLLVNGAAGIAVGMATNIPPHNLGEVCDALCYMLDQEMRGKEVSLEEILQFIQGPDFPTGGVVYRYAQREGAEVDVLANAYAVGRGQFVVQAKAHIEEMSRSRHRIVVTELPYQVNKAHLVERIAELAREGRLEGIADLRDESDRTGMRLVIELTRTVDPREVLAQLFRLTPMQSSFGVTLLALVDGEPRLLSLRRMLELFLAHRQEVVRRRSRYDLERARQRAHILEGLRIALDHLQEVVETIRRSRDAETAHRNLRQKFGLTAVQAQAILDMPLRRIAALERRKVDEEYKEKQQEIAYLEDLLANPRKLLKVIRAELQDLKARYADPRRTQIVAHAEQPLTARDLLPDQTVAVALGENGEVTRWPVPEDPGGWKELLGALGKASPLACAVLNTRQDLLCITARGEAALLPAHRVPEAGATHFADLCGLTRRDQVVALLPLPPEGEGLFLFLGTAQGVVKRVRLEEVRAAAARGVTTVVQVGKEDALVGALLTDGSREVVLVSSDGRAIRFAEEQVRPAGLPAGGVAGMRLEQGASVVTVVEVEGRAALLVVTERGYAKRSDLDEYPVQGRGGAGVLTSRVSAETGPVVGAAVVTASDLVWVRTARRLWSGQARRVAKQGRSTRGERLPLAEGDRAVRVLRAPRAPEA
ncbi:MAG: DNA gyrase/topoisomerase IV subunit A, partial [Anaerolineae bacterium]